MSRQLVVVVVSASVVLGISAAAYAASSGPITHPLTIRTVQVGGHQEFITINHRTTDQTGNEFIVSGPLLKPNSTRHIGWLRAVCVITTTQFGIGQCGMTAQLREGSVDVGGALNFNIGTTSVLGVTGGTGSFRNARGQVEIHNISDSSAGLPRAAR
jgi:hypothetical protein